MVHILCMLIIGWNVLVTQVGFALEKPGLDRFLEGSRSNATISIEELTYWDSVVNSLLKSSNFSVGNTNRLYAYLYNAQKAFADESFDLTGRYSGSLGPISAKILKLFFPHFQEEKRDDLFSDKLAGQVMKSFEKRFQEEQAAIHPMKLQINASQWKGNSPYYGLEHASMQPWIIKKANAFRLSPPPSPEEEKFWQGQLAIVKQAVNNATERQKEAVYFWAGMAGAGSGDWIAIANKYMNRENVPLSKQLLVRSKLATALFDTMVAVYDSKYTYLVKRPFMWDPQLKTIITTPNHPSYPAGHSADSTAAATVLSYYFPENRARWKEMGEEAGFSRIWAGIHFPIDNEAGNALGRKIANAVLQQTPL